MKLLTVQGFTPEEFKSLIVQSIEEHLERKLEEVIEIGYSGFNFPSNKNKIVKDSIQYLTRGEVAKHLQISLPTLHSYTKEGLIKSYRIGGKVRYKAEDIEKALTERNFTAVNRKGGKNAA